MLRPYKDRNNPVPTISYIHYLSFSSCFSSVLQGHKYHPKGDEHISNIEHGKCAYRDEISHSSKDDTIIEISHRSCHDKYKWSLLYELLLVDNNKPYTYHCSNKYQ